MFKLSIIDTDHQRRLVLEGKLVPPWTAEVEEAWRRAGEQLQGRKLIIDLTNVTHIGPDGESILFKLMREGGKFCCTGVFTKHLLKRLARGALKHVPCGD
jgi:anti-anti-sigma regulatory factor